GPAALPGFLQTLQERDDLARNRALYALEVLGPHGLPAGPVLKEMIQKGKSDLRGHALQVLAKTGADGHAAVLALVNDPNAGRELRGQALGALRWHDDRSEQTVQTFCAALKDKEPGLRLTAVQVLGESGPKARSAIPALVEAFGDKELLKGTTKFFAAEALAAIGPDALPALVEALKDSEPLVRWQAARALANLRGKAKE